jgi:ATP-dependent DNA ligase
MEAYDPSRYIFPPRTKMTTEFWEDRKAGVPDSLVRSWMKYGDNVWAQYKLNGNRNLIKVFPDRKIQFWNRHAELQQTYAIPDEMREEILRISPAGVYTLWDSELMNFKTKDIKDIVYLYDVLVWESQWLTGVPYRQRYERLAERVGPLTIPLEPAEMQAPLYLAQNFTPDQWVDRWKAAKKLPWIEGLVLKRLDFTSVLEPGTQEYNNAGFMLRVRKPHKNYLK